MFDEHEPAEFKIAADLSAVERQLARLTPAAPRIDRDRLMFEAGRAAERAASELSPSPSLQGRGDAVRHRFWPAATATMTAASVFLATMLVWQRQALQLASQPGAPPIVATQAVDQPPTVSARHVLRPEMTTTGWTSLRQPDRGYLGVRYTALTRGVGALDLTSQASTSQANGDAAGDPATELQPTQRELLNELLPSSQRKTNPST